MKNVKIDSNKRLLNQIKRQFRKHVWAQEKEYKYRQGYKFIYFAIYLIQDEFVINYLLTRLMLATDDNLVTDIDIFKQAIKEWNVGKRVDNTNRATGIDPIDENSLVTAFPLVMKPFNDTLIDIKNKFFN